MNGIRFAAGLLSYVQQGLPACCNLCERPLQLTGTANHPRRITADAANFAAAKRLGEIGFRARATFQVHRPGQANWATCACLDLHLLSTTDRPRRGAAVLANSIGRETQLILTEGGHESRSAGNLGPALATRRGSCGGYFRTCHHPPAGIP